LKRVLIITYYWPPSGGSGVQRWLKFAKYLPKYGWQPVVYTPENPDFKLQDASLLKDIPKEVEVIKQAIWEPYKYATLFGKSKQSNTGVEQKKSNKESLSSKAMNWIRGNVFLPDPRVYWVKPSVKYLKQYIARNPVDIIVSTGPPHSMHLIANQLKQATGLPWIADFRDPFSKMDVYDGYYMMERSRKKNAQMERMVLTNCDTLLATSYSLPELLEPFDTQKMKTITNGFDASDFNIFPSSSSDKYLIFHAGTLNDVRNPFSLWKILLKWSKEQPELYKRIEIKLAGSISDSIKKEVEQNNLLKDKVEFLGYLSHKDIFRYYSESSLLLLAIHNTKVGKVCIPGKVFEYLAAHKHILALGDPSADAARIIKDLNAGRCVAYEDAVGTEQALLDLMLHFS